MKGRRVTQGTEQVKILGSRQKLGLIIQPNLRQKRWDYIRQEAEL